MPWGLKRYQQTRQLHFVTFSCYHRNPLLANSQACDIFVQTLETVRRWYGFWLIGYVVMPEHVHLLLSEPERENLALVLQMLKQMVSRNLQSVGGASNREGGPSYREAKGGDVQPFWQARYYDFNVWSEEKRVEKLRYIHRNPVKRGLVERPEDWPWSSFHHYLTGEEGAVEIESHWTATKREKQGIYPTVRRRDTAKKPRPSLRDRTGHPPTDPR
jgi:putative transposase